MTPLDADGLAARTIDALGPDAPRDLVASVSAIAGAGRAQYPDVVVSAVALAAELSRWWSLRSDGDVPVGPRAADVFVVCAALAGDEVGNRHVRAVLYEAATRARSPRATTTADDLAHQCWLRLMASAPDEPPRVLRYVGAGPLAGLARVTATRIALNDGRGSTSTHTLADGLPEASLEGAFARTEYAEAVKDAFESSVAALEDTERLILRLHLVDTLSIDQISELLDVHRATAARRIDRARERVGASVRARLEQRLGAGSTADALMREIRSQLDLSLSRVLREPP